MNNKELETWFTETLKYITLAMQSQGKIDLYLLPPKCSIKHEVIIDLVNPALVSRYKYKGIFKNPNHQDVTVFSNSLEMLLKKLTDIAEMASGFDPSYGKYEIYKLLEGKEKPLFHKCYEEIAPLIKEEWL